MILQECQSFIQSQPLIMLFLILATGLALGKVSIKGIHLGSSGVLFSALLAGHFGFKIPPGIGTFGLVLFVYCVGIGAGSGFFASFKKEGANLAKLAFFIVLQGALITWIGAQLLHIPSGLATGIFAGALTSTPALATACEGGSPELANAASIGYSIAYPFGVIGVVLFVQLLPRLLKINLDSPAEALTPHVKPATHKPTCLLSLSVGLTLGMILGKIPFGSFQLGLAGGPLLIGLILSHIKKCGPIVAHIPKNTRTALQELGLIFFLANAGINGGSTLAATIQEHGFKLFGLGATITLIPLISAWFLAKYALKMPALPSLGGICGGMTSTPALGAITAKTDNPTPVMSYVAAYPVALIVMIITSKILIRALG